jgi:hypothetical protein
MPFLNSVHPPFQAQKKRRKKADIITDDGNVYNTTPDSRRQIGVVSALALIFNRIIGTGIFATPSSILSLTGSVGLALFIWVIGLLIALAGTAVYLEWGTAIPRYVSFSLSLVSIKWLDLMEI